MRIRPLPGADERKTMRKLIVIALIGAVAFVILKKKGFIGAN